MCSATTGLTCTTASSTCGRRMNPRIHLREHPGEYGHSSGSTGRSDATVGLLVESFLLGAVKSPRSGETVPDGLTPGDWHDRPPAPALPPPARDGFLLAI